ncbi:MAG TPA: hypothetical protein VLJ42_09520 [Solirubrobacteraceae bacterium]|nr:hypothetical protein [Solirubrobacteraceae bacterium]
MRRASICLILLACAAGCPVAALAYPTTQIAPAFSNNKLGAGTFVSFSGVTTNTTGGLPGPIHEAVIHLPLGLGVHTAGFATCSAGVLERDGPGACSAASKAGPLGSAVGKAPLGDSIVTEPVTIQPFLGPPDAQGHTQLVLYANGVSPVSVQYVIVGTLLADDPPFGQKLVIPIPEIDTVPGAQPASIVSFKLAVGATRVGRVKVKTHGKVETVRAKIYGITVPKRCPKGGFPWRGEFHDDGDFTSIVTAKSPCPKR